MNNEVFGVAIIVALSTGLAFSTHASEAVSKTKARTLVDENDKFKVKCDIDDKDKVLNIRILDGVVNTKIKQKLTKEVGNWTFGAGSPKTDVTSTATLKKS